MSDTIQCACRGRSRAFLLDPVGEENGFIIKRMQQRAVRNHFIKKRRQTAGQGTKECGSVWIREIDAVSSCLSKDRTGTDKKRGAKCQKVIAGCTGERQRPYEEDLSGSKDLPEISGQIRLFEKAKDLFHGQKKKRFLKISVAVLAVLVLKNSERMRTDTAELRMDAEKLEAADREADAAEGQIIQRK